MSVIRRGGQSALLFCLIALALPCAAVRAAPDSPPAPDAKATDALVRDALKSVINEGADMYNAQGRYNEHDYLGCHHLYEGALIATRPLLASHPDLQKAIDEGLENARNTPHPEMRAFVLRDVIDQIRDGLKPGGPTVTPIPVETTTTGKMVALVRKTGFGAADLVLDVDGKQMKFPVDVAGSATGPVMIDGKPGKYEDIKKDSLVTITTKSNEVTKVEAKGPAASPPPKVATTIGKVVGVDKDKLTVSVDEKVKVFTVPADARVTIDGEEGKLAGLKKDGTATITTQNDVVVTIDAKNQPTPPVTVGKTEGKATKIEKDKLTITDADNKEQTFSIGADAKVTIDGKDGKAEDIKPDSIVTVITTDGKVVKVDAKAPAVPPPPPVETKTSGKVIKVAGNKITVLPATGEAKDFTLPADAKITIDGKDGQIDGIKVDSTATVTTKGDAVTKVEAKAPVPLTPAEKTTPGKITKIDLDRKKLTVKDDHGESTEFTVPADAKITIDDKDAKLDALKVDSTVTVSDKDGVVTRITVKTPGAPPPQTLWERLGGETGVAKVVDDFVNTAGKDPKVNFYRDLMHVPSKEEEAALKTHLVAFVSSATGGPLKYTGKDMKTVHAGMKIKDAEFDACEADLKAALEKNGVKAEDVKAVMDAVEGTRKDIVEVKGDDKPKPP